MRWRRSTGCGAVRARPARSPSSASAGAAAWAAAAAGSTDRCSTLASRKFPHLRTKAYRGRERVLAERGRGVELGMRTTIRDILRMKQAGERIAVLTSYDFPSARLAERAGVRVL